MKRRNLLSTLLFCLAFTSVNAQFLSTSGTKIINDNNETVILRGMGLGGWMLQEGYMLQTAEFADAQHVLKQKIKELIGTDATEEFYDAWLKNHVTRADIDSMAAWGFNSVRLPMHYNLYTLPIEDEPVSGENTWLDRGFEMTDSLIEWCKANEMYVILDLHAAPGGQGGNSGISDYDPSKPSLWQSAENQDKTIALWRRLAERYKDEPWIGGYDLLNEVNWDLPGGTALRSIYERITEQIREVDQKHIIFIEGNWYANDFTGLTPPWDDNMVYSPHKYWSYNEQSDIEFATKLRRFNVPLYFGEAGENSNAWFRDAIKLFEDNGIGWAWWPEKKIESISGLMSIAKTPEYETLLNYWKNGGNPPNNFFAKATLLELAENTKIENCRIQKDVIDAMIRQPHTTETKPFKKHNIPGKIHAADYDMGIPGFAYQDLDVATYHVSNGNFTAWNTGWSYRNDGVDIEPTRDTENSIGHNVGWIDENEWMQYEITVDEPGAYDVLVRTATEGTSGRYHLEMDGAQLTGTRYVPRTGGYQTWQTATIPEVVLTAEDKKLRFYAEGSGFNLSSLEFVRTGDASAVGTKYVSSVTGDEQTVHLSLNKKIVDPGSDFTDDFQLRVNGTIISITDAVINADNPRIISFTVDHVFKSGEFIKISYSGNSLEATDGTKLQTFALEDVLNTISEKIQIPGKMQAEAFADQTGIQLEACSDVGGGENIGYLEPGDYADYDVDVTQGGTFNVVYRTASQSKGGSLKLQRIDGSGNAIDLHSADFSATGGWQDWSTSNGFSATLPRGEQVIRLLITGSEFNVNWVEFSFVSGVEEADSKSDFAVYPNPNDGIFFVENLGDFEVRKMEVFDVFGKLVFSEKAEINAAEARQIDLSNVASGAYFLKISTSNGNVFSQRILKE